MNPLNETYRLQSDIQHVLSNAGMYIGSVEPVAQLVWLYDDEKMCIEKREISFVSGLYKMFDEVLINCRDHYIRVKDSQNPVTLIDISISEQGLISIMNTGEGIDAAMHPEHNIFIPEMLFGHLRSSTNYNEKEDRIVGGRHGLGVKLVFIWSKSAVIEGVDSKRALRYVQKFGANLSSIDKPLIKACAPSTAPYTKITFMPDYARMGLDGIPKEMIQAFHKRVYDLCVVTPGVRIRYNGRVIPKRTFANYIACCAGKDAGARKIIHETEHWRVGICKSKTGHFEHMSFVNGIHTSKGGRHVEYVSAAVTKLAAAALTKRRGAEITPITVREQLFFFISTNVINPAFDSQIKDCLTSPVKAFAEKYAPPDELIQGVCKLVGDVVCALTLARDQVRARKVARESDGVKTASVRGISKLVDANWAGTRKSAECILILCEGDSAAAGVRSGLTTEDRNRYGIYPIRGKLPNIHGRAEAKNVLANKILIELKQILGLESDKVYDAAALKKLRYGKLVFITDQDLDGQHIKALGVNLLHVLWPSLLEVRGFVGYIQTPVLKARKGARELCFYNEAEYRRWSENAADREGWTLKYYKGLGTSTGAEFRQYFRNVKIIHFVHTGKECDETLEMVFDKKRADDRKIWLQAYNRDLGADLSRDAVSYVDFINCELIHFSKYDCDRSIPNMMDGLKISQRKILFCAFKKNITKEIKVAQLSGYISEHSHYHHGEESLGKAIVGMAQTFVGSNNINLLVPSGQFGTRLAGGADAASARYIYTYLPEMARAIYRAEDDSILDYLKSDGHPIEPRFYAPIVPMIVINGALGIGTGFSCEVLPHKLEDVVEYIRARLGGAAPSRVFAPHFRGFKGAVRALGDEKYITEGIFSLTRLELVVTELPIGHWTQAFKDHLEILLEKKIITDYKDRSTDAEVDFVIQLSEEMAAEDVIKCFKLRSSHSQNNMYLFDHNDRLRKFACVADIIDAYFETRLDMYEARRRDALERVRGKIEVARAKVEYISMILDGRLTLFGAKSSQLAAALEARNFIKIDGSFQYLLKMPLDSLCAENIIRHQQALEALERELDYLENITPSQLWLEDLAAISKIK